MAARRALEWIGGSKARLVFRYEISDLFPSALPITSKAARLDTRIAVPKDQIELDAWVLHYQVMTWVHVGLHHGSLSVQQQIFAESAAELFARLEIPV